MFGARRNFLRTVAVGFLGSAGLLVPGKVRAGWRRCGPSVCYPVVPACAPVFAPVEMQPRLVDSVTLLFPSPNSPGSSAILIPGGGFFCAWGKKAAGIVPSMFYISATSTPPLPPPAPTTLGNTSTTALTTGIPSTWGYSVTGCPTDGTNFYLVFVYQVSGTLTQSVWGPYQCF